jgi:hypothetical protein
VVFDSPVHRPNVRSPYCISENAISRRQSRPSALVRDLIHFWTLTARQSCRFVCPTIDFAIFSRPITLALRQSLDLASDRLLDGDRRRTAVGGAADRVTVRRGSVAHPRIDYPSIGTSWTMPQPVDEVATLSSSERPRQNVGGVLMPSADPSRFEVRASRRDRSASSVRRNADARV